MDARALPSIATRDRQVRIAMALLVLTAGTIAGAWLFQAAGYPPCELCLRERLPYYAGTVLAAAILALAWRGAAGAARAGFACIAALFLFSAAFGAYHAGVEWGFWPGPTDCTGALARAASSADFLHQLATAHIVRCDAVAIRILGLSLAGWNAVVSIVVLALAVTALASPRSRGWARRASAP